MEHDLHSLSSIKLAHELKGKPPVAGAEILRQLFPAVREKDQLGLVPARVSNTHLPT